MLSNFKNIVSQTLVNVSGFRTDCKIVVFESDDWGSIRTPSQKVIDNLKSFGIDLDKNPYSKNDGLEKNSDVEYLFEILSKYKDSYGSHPIITKNFVTCNPDFKKIEKDLFKMYHNQKIDETYEIYEESNGVLSLMKNGIEAGLILPQYHGREHVNVEYWMELLNEDDYVCRKAFEYGVSGLSKSTAHHFKKNMQATYDTTNTSFVAESLLEGLNLFKEIFNFNSKSFIPNNFTLDDVHFKLLLQNNVKIIQGMKYQLFPNSDNQIQKRILRRNGEVNALGQTNIVRNCNFEPTESKKNYIYTLKEIKLAFFFNQPAVISSHRINFTSRISEKNRDVNLVDFDLLLKSILKLWPDVQFMTTLELANYYREKND